MKAKKRIVKIRENDVTPVDVEIDNRFVEFYKKETGRVRATIRGLSKFINNLIKLHSF
jgi:hypothetical protein